MGLPTLGTRPSRRGRPEPCRRRRGVTRVRCTCAEHRVHGREPSVYVHAIYTARIHVMAHMHTQIGGISVRVCVCVCRTGGFHTVVTPQTSEKRRKKNGRGTTAVGPGIRPEVRRTRRRRRHSHSQPDRPRTVFGASANRRRRKTTRCMRVNK